MSYILEKGEREIRIPAVIIVSAIVSVLQLLIKYDKSFTTEIANASVYMEGKDNWAEDLRL